MYQIKRKNVIKIQFSFAVSVTERVWGCSSHCADPDSVHALGHYNTPKHHCAHYIQETGGIWGLHACFSDADYSVKVKWYLQVGLFIDSTDLPKNCMIEYYS